MTFLCYTTPPTGTHLTRDERRTLCDLQVLDVPRVPRQVEALRCAACHRIEYRAELDEPCARCGHPKSSHGPTGCEVEVRDYGELDCFCRRFARLLGDAP